MCKINKYAVAIDAGKHAMKFIGKKFNDNEPTKVTFRTKMYDLSEGYIDLEGNSYKVKFEDKEYIVGEQGTIDSAETSKTDFLHQLITYTAITKLLEPGTKNNEIYAVLACPLSVLRIESAKENYKKFIKGNGPIKLEVNGQKYEFEIKEIMIKAEGSGITYTHKELFLDKNIGLIDFGGLNLSASLYRNRVCNATDRYIDIFGANELIKRVKIAMENLQEGNTINILDAEQILEKGYMTELGQINVITQEEIKKVKIKFLDDAIANIEKNAFKIKQLDGLVFVGGTTQKIKEQISLKFPNSTIPANSEWSTADGLYIIACKKYIK